MSYQNLINKINGQNPLQENQSLSGSGSGLAVSGNPAGTLAAPNNKGSGSGFTNLQDYVTANEGQGERMGAGLEASAKVDANNATTALGNYSTAQQGLIQAGTHLASGGGASTVLNPATAPVDGHYDGPNDFTAPTAPKVTLNSGLSQTPEGVNVMLGDRYKAPEYSNAMKGLDSFLTGQGGSEHLKNIQGMDQQYVNDGKTITDVLSGKRTAAQQAVMEKPITLADRDPLGTSMSAEINKSPNAVSPNTSDNVLTHAFDQAAPVSNGVNGTIKNKYVAPADTSVAPPPAVAPPAQVLPFGSVTDTGLQSGWDSLFKPKNRII